MDAANWSRELPLSTPEHSATQSIQGVASPLAPAPGEVRIWRLAVDALPEATLTRWIEFLDNSERGRAERFHFRTDRDHYIAAHALTRAMLSAFTGKPPADLRFLKGRGEKPEIALDAGIPPLRFNLSHTPGLVACAVAWRDDVGLDVEALNRPHVDASLADSYFAPAEKEQISSAPTKRKRELFLRLWTLKEAYLKATGEGLARPLHSFAFTFDPIRIAFETSTENPEDWQFAQLHPTGDHVMAVALRGAEAPLRLNIRTVTDQHF
jgi:4'-phosphopantetheinyl transferase